jgi:hypothetical protein
MRQTALYKVDESWRVAPDGEPPFAEPCVCAQPFFLVDEHGDRTCVYCGRRPANPVRTFRGLQIFPPQREVPHRAAERQGERGSRDERRGAVFASFPDPPAFPLTNDQELT